VQLGWRHQLLSGPCEARLMSAIGLASLQVVCVMWVRADCLVRVLR
jgi:hypothetical protein